MDRKKGILWAVIIIVVVNVSAGLTQWILRDDPESAQEIIEQQGELAKKIYAITLDDSNDSSVIEGCTFDFNEPNEPNGIVITPAEPNEIASMLGGSDLRRLEQKCDLLYEAVDKLFEMGAEIEGWANQTDERFKLLEATIGLMLDSLEIVVERLEPEPVVSEAVDKSV